MMTRKIRWRAAVAGAVIAEIALIAASFAWVAIYSYLINPNQPVTVYEQHAQASGPWVSLLAGIPIFYSAGRWLAKSAPTAVAMCVILLIFDALVLVSSVRAGASLPLLIVALSYLTKFAASYLGGRHSALRLAHAQP
ncbi:MAG: hypothetical protein HC853_06770 [Anaerolineae bacterium]|nr:hypothetical protein [Anaerolineae bacterium]